MMKDDDFKLLRGFEDGQTDERTDIGDCRVAFATENLVTSKYTNYFYLGIFTKFFTYIRNHIVFSNNL